VVGLTRVTPDWKVPPSLWTPAPEDFGPTVDYLHRIGQIAGKYTLDQVYEPNWGNIVLDVTGRGFATPTVRRGDVVFRVEYLLLDDLVTIVANTGSTSVPLAEGSVAAFYSDFVTAAGSLGIPAPGSTIEPEITDAPHFDVDTEHRPYDAVVVQWVAGALAGASAALTEWQAPYRGHRPRVGIMWGGFDLSATRYNGQPVEPPATQPMFQRNGMTEAVVAVGFVLGDDSTHPYFYAYVSPEPGGLAQTDFGVDGAAYSAEDGLAKLPWDVVTSSADPDTTIVQFADAVWHAAVELGGWDAALVLARRDGWYASQHPMFGSSVEPSAVD
jgi:Family of unknown function (DUF5996)